MKTEELIRYYKANIEAIEKGLNNDSLLADKKFRLGYTQQALDGYKSYFLCSWTVVFQEACRNDGSICKRT